MQSKTLEYRNGIYQGQTKNNKRHGYGILIADDAKILVGNWKNDQLYGQAFIIVSHEEYGFGEFNRGQLQGYFIFRAINRTFFAEYNFSRPINKMCVIDYQKQIQQVIIHKSPIFQVLHEDKLHETSQQEVIINNCLNIKFRCPSILEYLQSEFCGNNENGQNQSCFKFKPLNNGNFLFSYDSQSNPNSLGFSLNKNGKLVGYGMYVNDKLNGLGCKYENTIRYQGMFQNGFVHGIGLRYNQGKYSFGEFSNGNLTEALFIDDRSSISQQKLNQFKKSQHLRSLWHYNAYIRKDILKFKGTKQLIFQMNTQQEYMYPQTNYTTSANKKSGNKNLAIKMIKRDDFDTKSSKSFLVRPGFNRTPEEDDDGFSQSNMSGKGLSALRKFKL